MLVPNDEGFSSVTDAEKVEETILQRNITHFSQAQGTPFTSKLMSETLGIAGTNAEGEDILDPSRDTRILEEELAGGHQATRDILSYLRRMPNRADIDCRLTTKEVASAISNWRESTSTSPSGVHLGHYKALVKWIPDDEEAQTRAEQLLSLRTSLINAGVSAGFCYPRWEKIQSSMLEKIPGIPRIDKLRVIHIYEADLNLALGVLWSRKLIPHNEATGSLHSEQWGSRKGRSATDAAGMKYFAYGLSRLTATDLGTLDNDAKACYDRIVIRLGTMRSRMLGMPQGSCEMVAKLGESAQYHVKTALRVSPTYYTSTPDNPLHGNGQGRRDSPAVWTEISTMGLDLMKGHGRGMRFRHPTADENIDVAMIAYVDDKTVWCNQFDDQIKARGLPQQPGNGLLLEHLRESGQRWADVLHATGGKLELSKCFYYAVSWIADEQGRPRLSTEPQAGRVPLVDPDGAEHSLQYSAPTAAHKTLGVHMSPCGSNGAERKAIAQKCSKFTRLIHATSTLQRRDIRPLHDQFFIPSVGYSLVFASIDRRSLDQYQSGVLCSLLPRAGFNRHLPRAVVHAPTGVGGLGWRSLYSHQGLSQVALLIQHLRHGGELGTMIHIWMGWLRRVAGTSRCPLATPNAHILTVRFHIPQEKLRS